MAVVSAASSAQRATSSLTGSTAALTRSASAKKSRIIVLWRRSTPSVSVVSRSAGWARRMTSLRSSGRPASPAPSSLMISRKRSR